MGEERVDRHEFWLRSLRSWDLAFAVLVALVAASALAVPATWTRRWAVYGLLAVLVAAYLGLARPGAMAGAAARVNTYLAVLVTVTALSAALVNSGFILLFVAYSQIWFFSRRRWQGTAWCILQTGSIVLAVAWTLDDLGAAWTEVGTQMLASLAFAIALGLWITQLAEVSESRAELVERLEAAQAELAASHHAAGVLAERERVSQEIHDTLAQGFTSVVMLAQTAAALIEHGRVDDAAGRVAQIEHVARDNLAEARALVAAFGPAGLQDSTLSEALARLARRFEAETGVRVEVDVDPGAATRPDVAVVLLRTAQEALANVRRHAAASHVRLHLVVDRGSVGIDVSDDGRGLPDDLREGVGLTGMRERAAAGGGTFEVAGAPGLGTRVRLTLPVTP